MFAVFCVCVTTLVYSVVGEPDWTQVESPYLVARDALLREGEYDTAYVGSSVTFRQVDPQVVEAETPGALPRSSINLGNPGFFPPRSVDYLERLVREPPSGLQRIYAELFRLDRISFNYRAPEIMRMITPGLYIDTMRTIAGADFSARYKVYLWWQYTRALGYKYTGFSMLRYQATERELKPFMEERLQAAPLGFYAKDVELAASAYAENLAKLRRVRSSFAGKEHRVGPRRQLHIDKYQRDWPLQSVPYVARLNRLIDEAAAKGIDLIFVLPPLLTPAGVQFAYPVYLHLPEAHRIDLSDPIAYPLLYDANYMFDLEHVNAEGAALLSAYLAAATLELRPGD